MTERERGARRLRGPMILVDTSAWTEYLRGTGSGTHFRLRELLAADAVLGTTDVVHMELLAGAREEHDDVQLRRMLAALEHIPVEPLDWEAAARLHRACYRQGETVRSLTDCLVAAVAIRVQAPVLAHDRDFVVLARLTDLELA
jgi:predicted nucleic acid-binding protein